MLQPGQGWRQNTGIFEGKYPFPLEEFLAVKQVCFIGQVYAFYVWAAVGVDRSPHSPDLITDQPMLANVETAHWVNNSSSSAIKIIYSVWLPTFPALWDHFIEQGWPSHRKINWGLQFQNETSLLHSLSKYWLQMTAESAEHAACSMYVMTLSSWYHKQMNRSLLCLCTLQWQRLLLGRRNTLTIFNFRMTIPVYHSLDTSSPASSQVSHVSQFQHVAKQHHYSPHIFSAHPNLDTFGYHSHLKQDPTIIRQEMFLVTVLFNFSP